MEIKVWNLRKKTLRMIMGLGACLHTLPYIYKCIAIDYVKEMLVYELSDDTNHIKIHVNSLK